MGGPGAHGSQWLAEADTPERPTLVGEHRAEVAVVGGGITGLTTALMLAAEGRSVVVLEARRIGRGTTGSTSAHLTAVPDYGFHTLESRFDAATVRAAWGTGCDAIDRIEALCREHAIDCDFARVPGYQLESDGDDHPWFERNLRAAERCGVPFEHEVRPDLPMRANRAVRFDRQARFQPVRYLAGLATALGRAGGAVYEHSRVTRIASGEPSILTTDHGTVRADHVVLATHTPPGVALLFQARMTAFRSYCLAMRLTDRAFPDALFWNSREPYDYVRRHGDVLIIGGRDHRTGAGRGHGGRWRELEAWSRQNLPVGEVLHRWSANLYEPGDGLPYIGPMPGMPGAFVATGYSGTGLTYGTAAAMLITDLVAGRENGWRRIYAPTRLKPVASAGRLVEENAGTAWHFVKDRLAPSEVRSLDDVPSGEGRLVRVDGRKMACYRDPDGQLHVMSAVCPHLACVVRWNDAEASWDCPCHGSRFGPTGELLDGPAMRDLERAAAPDRPQGPQAPSEPEPV